MNLSLFCDYSTCIIFCFFKRIDGLVGCNCISSHIDISIDSRCSAEWKVISIFKVVTDIFMRFSVDYLIYKIKVKTKRFLTIQIISDDTTIDAWSS